MNNRCYTYFRIVGKFNTDDISHILNLTPEKKWDIGDVSQMVGNMTLQIGQLVIAKIIILIHQFKWKSQ